MDNIRPIVEEVLGLQPVPVTPDQITHTPENPSAFLFYPVKLIQPGHPYKLTTTEGMLTVEQVGLMASTRTAAHYKPGLWFYGLAFQSGGKYYPLPRPIPKSTLGLSEEGKFYDLPPKPIPPQTEGITHEEYQDVYHRLCGDMNEAWGAFKAIAYTKGRKVLNELYQAKQKQPGNTQTH